MDEHDTSPQPVHIVFTVQVIAAALMFGAVIFAGVAAWVVSSRQQPPSDALLAYVAVGMAIVLFIARSIIPARIVNTQRMALAKSLQTQPQPESELEQALGQVFLMKTIFELAISEGAAFSVLAMFFVSGHWWLLAIVGVVLAVKALSFPTNMKYQDWLHNQHQLMNIED